MSAPRIINPATASGGVPVGGSGAAGYVAKWTAATTLGGSATTGADASLYVDATGNVGVGTASPGSKLQVAGDVSVLSGGVFLSTGIAYLQSQTAGANSIQFRPGGVASVYMGTASMDASLVSGYGLKLPSAPGNADAQTLDCYQENPLATTSGNGWTPTIGGTAAQWGGTLPTVSFARYVQIGSIVFCDVRLTSASIQSTYGLTTITPPPPTQNAFASEVVVPASTAAGGVTGNGAQFSGLVYLPTLAASTAIRLTWFYFTTS